MSGIDSGQLKIPNCYYLNLPRLSLLLPFLTHLNCMKSHSQMTKFCTLQICRCQTAPQRPRNQAIPLTIRCSRGHKRHNLQNLLPSNIDHQPIVLMNRTTNRLKLSGSNDKSATTCLLGSSYDVGSRFLRGLKQSSFWRRDPPRTLRRLLGPQRFRSVALLAASS